MGDFSEGDTVKWSWVNGTGTGKVVTRYTRKITLSIKGTDVTRNASDDEPAFRIRQDDGDEVLKSITEIETA